MCAIYYCGTYFIRIVSETKKFLHFISVASLYIIVNLPIYIKLQFSGTYINCYNIILSVLKGSPKSCSIYIEIYGRSKRDVKYSDR